MQSAANSQPDVQPFLSEARRPTAKRRRTMKSSKVSNIVLVRGGFVDGSGWESVYAILKNKGFNVSIVQNPTISLADDVVVTNRTINAQDGPVVLVGRSYGGAVITESRQQSEGRSPHRLRSRQRRIGRHSDQGPHARRAGTADHAATGWLPLARSHKVRGFFRSRCRTRPRGLHGRLPGALGTGCAQWSGHQCLVEEQAELVPGGDRRQDDPSRYATFHGKACWSHCCRSQRQPRDLRFTASGGADLIAQAA
jgi:hypothetical protein